MIVVCDLFHLGIPCWLIRDLDPNNGLEQVVFYQLQNEAPLLESISTAKASLEETLVESSESYSVLYVPNVPRKKGIPDEAFAISDVLEYPLSKVPTDEHLVGCVNDLVYYFHSVFRA